jgi:hypothetical protein
MPQEQALPVRGGVACVCVHHFGGTSKQRRGFAGTRHIVLPFRLHSYDVHARVAATDAAHIGRGMPVIRNHVVAGVLGSRLSRMTCYMRLAFYTHSCW